MSNATPRPASQLGGASGFFTSNLEGWGNDDLLMTERARAAARAENPDIYRVLDWEDLRNAFAIPEKEAMAAKDKSRQVAFWGACAVGAGAALLALSPLFIAPIIPAAALTGLFFTVGGGLLSLHHLIQTDGRRKWLAKRAKAERLRQFYFQFFINNLPLTCDAVADAGKFEDLRVARDAALQTVLTKLTDDEKQRPNLTINDHRHRETWLMPTWQNSSAPKRHGTQADGIIEALLHRLATQRILIQQRYAEINREIAINTPIAQHSLLDAVGNLLTLGVMAAAIWGGAALFSGAHHELPIALVGVFGAFGVSARLLQRGLSLRADIERYDWYAEVIEACRTRFESGGIEQKIFALRDLEAYSYAELRQFLRAHRYESVL